MIHKYLSAFYKNLSAFLQISLGLFENNKNLSAFHKNLSGFQKAESSGSTLTNNYATSDHVINNWVNNGNISIGNNYATGTSYQILKSSSMQVTLHKVCLGTYQMGSIAGQKQYVTGDFRPKE